MQPSIEHAAPPDQIAFLGGGNMARAMIAGLLRQGASAASLRVADPRDGVRAALAEQYGIATYAENCSAVGDAALIVLAVKPQDAATALGSARACWERGSAALLSIAAGLRVGALSQLCPAGTAIVRAMPNRPALLGAGVTGLYAAPGVPARARALTEAVAAAMGPAVWVQEEAQLDVVTALSGSGPAYFLLLAEQLARAAQACGLPEQIALLLASETLYGSGILAHARLGAPGALAEERAAVTSPGGTTEAALRVLEGGGFEQLVARAVRAAAARSGELADRFAAELAAR